MSYGLPTAQAGAQRPASALKKKPSTTEKARGLKEEASAPKTPSKLKDGKRGKFDDLDFAEPNAENSGDFVEPTEPEKVAGASARKPGRVPGSTKKN